MEYWKLDRTALRVSPLCLGTMNFGPATAEAEGHRILDVALGAGINFIDTANRYGRVVNTKPPADGRPTYPGLSEKIVGRWLRKSGRRDSVVLATRLHNTMGDGPNDKELSAYHIRRACEDSLRRLGTDRIDPFQMHQVDRSAPWEEIWQVMEQLVREGKVLYVGSSNFAAWRITVANAVAQARHFLGIVSEQSQYSLAARMVELEVLPACEHLGVGVIPWGPLQSGRLGGLLARIEAGGRSSRGSCTIQRSLHPSSVPVRPSNSGPPCGHRKSSARPRRWRASTSSGPDRVARRRRLMRGDADKRCQSMTSSRGFERHSGFGE